jgi:ribosomal protein S18 acetylase RimI-like enzyme
MIEDVRKLIKTHNDVSDGVLIKMDVDDYVNKIVKFAIIINYYTDSKLTGFIAYYANDGLKKNAYLTLILIDNSFRGLGLGKLLLESSISDLSRRGFLTYKLEVLKSNSKAIKMYEKCGFTVEEDRGDLWLLNLNL